MKTIELIVSPAGETTLQTRGFSGDSCRMASAFLESALGTMAADQPTAEAFTALSDAAIQQPS